jgi:tetratricopeptide (TPR) repeat protein
MRDRKSPLNACILSLLAALLLVHAAAWGEESVKGAKECVTIPSAAAAVQTGSNPEDELAAARENVRTNPTNVPYLVRLAYLLVDRGMLDEAMSRFDEALKINPRACDAKTGRGVVLARKGNLKEAEQTLKDALLLNPNPVRTHYELGLVYEKLGDPEKAVAEFKEGIRKHEQGRL